MCLKIKLLLMSFFAFSAVIVTVNSIPTSAAAAAASEDEEEDESAHHQDAEQQHEHGYSFHKFSGPVSGEIKPIYVPDGHDGKQRLDYFANPDYSYSYGVKDPATGNKHGHQESRHGDAVHGQYSVLQSDGATRVVKYTADPKNGFQAIVEYH